MKILHIDSSINGAASASRGLTQAIVDQYKSIDPSSTVEYLDLAVSAPAHLAADSIGFRLPEGSADSVTSQQQKENALSEDLVVQFLNADVVVVGAPLYNFTIPSQLKAWIDRIAQPRRTFKYTENGVVGLAAGKTVVVASTRGGIYSTSEAGQAMEHQESYLKTIFGFMGVTDVRIVRAEGLATGSDNHSSAMAAAAQEIAELTQESAFAAA